jgi:hypothetical protein
MSGNVIRAVRNSNPGNVERGDPWQGIATLAEMTDEQRDEKRFVVFKAPKWGFRAIARILIVYQDKYHIRTIGGAINRWAPPKENDTAAYIKSVCLMTKRGSTEVLDFHAWEDLYPVVKAIAIHESGGWWFEQRDLEAGLRLAGVEPPAKALVASRTIKTATVATAATGVSMIAEITQQVAPTMTFVRQVADFAPWVAGALVLVLLGAIIYYRVDDWQRAAR